MQTSAAVTCETVHRQLKAFLEDMLTEGEYQAILTHLETCVRCKKHVQMAGAISSQLSQLVNVKVPIDLRETVCFKLRQPGFRVQAPKATFRNSEKAIIAVFVGIVLLIVTSLLIYYFKIDTPQPQTEKVAVEMSVAEPSAAVPKYQRRAFSDKSPKQILREVIVAEEEADKEASDEEVSKKLSEETGVEEGSESAVRANADDRERLPAELDLSDAQAGAASEPVLLHWHFQYTGQNNERELLRMLRGLNITPEEQAPNMLVFSAQGESVESLLEELLMISQQSPVLTDFTGKVPVFPDEPYRVAAYFKADLEEAEHWHVGGALPHQKERLFGFIREKAGNIEYVLENLAIVTVQKTEVEHLRRRVRAMRLKLMVFKDEATTSAQAALISKPVKLSVYFEAT